MRRKTSPTGSNARGVSLPLRLLWQGASSRVRGRVSEQEGAKDHVKALSRREKRGLAAGLIEECQAFLVGSYADHLDGKGLTIPTWAWTNLLAHGSVADLHRAEDSSHTQGSPAHLQWRAARSHLAREILDQSRNCPVDLEELQRKVLIPLELELARRCEASTRSDPHAWVVAVRAALALRR